MSISYLRVAQPRQHFSERLSTPRHIDDSAHADNTHADTTHADKALDEALDESFPASDPVAVSISTAVPSAGLRQMPAGTARA